MILQYIFLVISLIAVVEILKLIELVFNINNIFLISLLFFPAYGFVYLYTKNVFVHYEIKQKFFLYSFLIVFILIAFFFISGF